LTTSGRIDVMKFLRGKRAVPAALGAVAVVAIAFGLWRTSQPWIPEGWTAPLTPPPAYAQTSGTALTGWAWSSNIGWVSFNCANIATANCGAPGGTPDFKVSMDALGNLSDYAWSNNIGWVQFDDPGPYPSSGPSHSAKMEMGNLTGWARAISPRDLPGSDGWDGWISLSGKTTTGEDYGVKLGPDGKSLDGFAWGSTVVGWLKFGLNLASNPSDCVDEVCIPGGGGEVLTCTPPTTIVNGDLTWQADITGGDGSLWNFTWNNVLGTQNTLHSAHTIPGTPGQTYPMTVLATNVPRGTSKTVNCDANIPGQGTLTVNVVHNETVGTVTSSSGGIVNCNKNDNSCTEQVAENTSVTLLVNNPTPEASIGWTLSSGATCGDGPSCTFTMPHTAEIVTVTISSASAPSITLHCYTDQSLTPCTTNQTVHIDISGSPIKPTSTPALYFAVSSGNSDSVSFMVENGRLANGVLRYINATTDTEPYLYMRDSGGNLLNFRHLLRNGIFTSQSTCPSGSTYAAGLNGCMQRGSITLPSAPTSKILYYLGVDMAAAPSILPGTYSEVVTVTAFKGSESVSKNIGLVYTVSGPCQNCDKAALSSPIPSITITSPGVNDIWPLTMKREGIRWNAVDVPTGASLSASLVNATSSAVARTESILNNLGSYAFPKTELTVPLGTYFIRLNAYVSGVLVAQGTSDSFLVQ